MDNIDITYMDDDFEFDKFNLSNSILNKIEKQNKNDNTEDIYKETYKIIDEFADTKNKLKEKNQEIELLNLELEKLKSDNEYLSKKYNNENEEKIKLNIQLKSTKNNLIEKEKKVLMLKTLLQLIIKEYGIEEISKISRLNMEQLKKFLN
jgi:hypothetical protein